MGRTPGAKDPCPPFDFPFRGELRDFQVETWKSYGHPAGITVAEVGQVGDKKAGQGRT